MNFTLNNLLNNVYIIYKLNVNKTLHPTFFDNLIKEINKDINNLF